ncbi:unnamed protein product [Lampetra planeri]
MRSALERSRGRRRAPSLSPPPSSRRLLGNAALTVSGAYGDLAVARSKSSKWRPGGAEVPRAPTGNSWEAPATRPCARGRPAGACHCSGLWVVGGEGGGWLVGRTTAVSFENSRSAY